MLTVSDIYAIGIVRNGSDAYEVSGFLTVSRHLTFLSQSQEEQEKAILVLAPGIIEKWINEIPAYGGSMVTFAGEATIKGYIVKSGLAPLPYAFYKISHIQFRSPHGLEVSYVPTAS